jgi:chorismate dehydratase
MVPPALADLRIGSVPYLNARPLVWGLNKKDVVFEVPAILSGSFERAVLDAALLPLFEVLRLGGGAIADNIAVACRGPVFSVIVASRESDFSAIKNIKLDPDSRSSVALLRVLLAEFYPNGPQATEGRPSDQDTRLLIGDPALKFRESHRDGWQYHDLGSLWQHHTGLPFVFAAWALRNGLPNQTAVAASLREVKDAGLASRPIIARQEAEPAFVLKYLTDHIRYDLGPDEKAAIRLFSHLASKHGLMPHEASITYS